MSSISNFCHRIFPSSSRGLVVRTPEKPYVKLGLAVTVSMVVCVIFMNYPRISQLLFFLGVIGYLYDGGRKVAVVEKKLPFVITDEQVMMRQLKTKLHSMIGRRDFSDTVYQLFERICVSRIMDLAKRDDEIVISFDRTHHIKSDMPQTKSLVIPSTVAFEAGPDGVIFKGQEAPFELWNLQERFYWKSIKVIGNTVELSLGDEPQIVKRSLALPFLIHRSN